MKKIVFSREILISGIQIFGMALQKGIYYVDLIGLDNMGTW